MLNHFAFANAHSLIKVARKRMGYVTPDKINKYGRNWGV